jgi:hypothetical protein
MRKVCLLGVVCLMIALPALAAADVEVTFYAAPDGATLIQGGQVFGSTPFTLKFSVKNKQCMEVGRVSVQWISGAEASVDSMSVCAANGKKQSFYFARPGAVPGVEVDTQYAGQLQQAELMRKQIVLQAYMNLQQRNAAQAAANQRSWDQLQASLLQYRQNSFLRLQTQTLQRTLRCTSRVVGNYIYTDCR